MYKPHSTVKVQSLFILNAKHSHQIIQSQSVKGSTSLPLYRNAPNSPVNFKKHIFSTIILLYYSNIETHSAMTLTLPCEGHCSWRCLFERSKVELFRFVHLQVSAETFETTTSGLVIILGFFPVGWHTFGPTGQLNGCCAPAFQHWQQPIGSFSLLTLYCSTLPLLCAHWPYRLEEVTKRWRRIHLNVLNPPIIWWYGCRVLWAAWGGYFE